MNASKTRKCFCEGKKVWKPFCATCSSASKTEQSQKDPLVNYLHNKFKEEGKYIGKRFIKECINEGWKEAYKYYFGGFKNPIVVEWEKSTSEGKAP
jgi:hypothetical protein